MLSKPIFGLNEICAQFHNHFFVVVAFMIKINDILHYCLLRRLYISVKFMLTNIKTNLWSVEAHHWILNYYIRLMERLTHRLIEVTMFHWSYQLQIFSHSIHKHFIPWRHSELINFTWTNSRYLFVGISCNCLARSEIVCKH